VKVITAKNWNLTPAADGRRYSKYPDGEVGDSFNVWVSASIDGVEPGYRIKPPGGEWGAWQAGHTEGPTGFVGVTTAVFGIPLSAAQISFPSVEVTSLDTLTESAAVVISSEGHEMQVRRKSSANDLTTRFVDVHIDTFVVSWAVSTNSGAGAEPGVRDDIIYTMNFSSWTSDATNPTSAPNGTGSTTDGAEIYNWVYQKNPPQSVLDLPHLEIKGGDHVAEGSRGALMTLYPPGWDPEVDYTLYGTGSAARARGTVGYVTAMRNIWNTTRYQNSKGYREEFWHGFSFWMPSDFVPDSGTGTNFQPIAWIMSSYSGVISALRFWSEPNTTGWRFTIYLANSASSATRVGDVFLPWNDNLRGVRNYFVLHFNADDRTPAQGGNPFFRVWHNRHGNSPALLGEVIGKPWGAGHLLNDDNRNDGFSGGIKPDIRTYKSGWHQTVKDGTYTGVLTSENKVVIGWDSVRWGGRESNFRSVHPLQQAQP
jgi:hypothetical protein